MILRARSTLCTVMALMVGGCVFPPGYEVDSLTIAADALNYAEVSGIVEQVETFPGSAPRATVTWYDAGYSSILAERTETIGSALDDVGDSQVFEFSDLSVYVTPALGGLDVACAVISVTNSNLELETEVGCLLGE